MHIVPAHAPCIKCTPRMSSYVFTEETCELRKLFSCSFVHLLVCIIIPERCHFNEKWLEKDEYKSWLWKDGQSSFQAFCVTCRKNIYLNVLGKCSLVSHMKGKKHGDYVKILKKTETCITINDFFLSCIKLKFHNGTIDWKSVGLSANGQSFNPCCKAVEYY